MSSPQDTPSWICGTGPMPDPQPRSRGSLPLPHRWVTLKVLQQGVWGGRRVLAVDAVWAGPPPTGSGARCWLLGTVCPRGQHSQVLAPNCRQCGFPAALGTSAQSLGSGRVSWPPLRPPQGPLVVTGSARHQGGTQTCWWPCAELRPFLRRCLTRPSCAAAPWRADWRWPSVRAHLSGTCLYS